MALDSMIDSKSASAGDNFLFELTVPTGEKWELLSVIGMNATNVSVVRLEVLDRAARTHVVKTHHQGRVTNFDYLEWEGNLMLDEGWGFRVLITYCESGDALDGSAIWRRYDK